MEGQSPGDMYFEDFQIGDRLRTPARTITRADVALFTAVTGDGPSLQADGQQARVLTPAECLAQSLMILAIGSGLLFRVGEQGIPRSTIALWGIENVHAMTPLKIGDTIHVESEVVQMMAIDAERALLTSRQRVLSQEGGEVATYTTKLLVGRRINQASAGEPPA